MKNKRRWLSVLVSTSMLMTGGFTAYAENESLTVDAVNEIQTEADEAVASSTYLDNEIQSDGEGFLGENISENIEAAPILGEEAIEAYGDEPEADLSVASVLSGAGTESAPYLIYSEDDLVLISSSSEYLGGYIQLQNDITLTTENWSPVGLNKSNSFKGTFDGNGYEISNVYIPANSYSYAGLFGYVTGTVKNLAVQADIAGGSTAGALAGMVDGGTIEYCYSTGAVSSVSGDTGGLIGFLQDGYVHDSYSTASVTNTGGRAGGLVGYMYTYKSNNKLKDCYAAGIVSGASNSGGLVGATGNHYLNQLNNILCGYYCSSTTKQTDTEKGFSVTSSKMKQQAIFEGWDFDNVWTIDSEANTGFPTLQLPVTTVKKEIELEGSGNEVDPFIISTEQELRALARGEVRNSYAAHYKLANDITVTSDYWTPIGGNGRDNFSGTFDGNGHVISGIKLSQKAFVNSGLFGIVTGTVKNLGVDVSVSGAGTAGALAGMVDGGTIEYCYSTGAVSSVSGDTGGLIGFLQNGYVHDSYSTASVTNTGGNAGGLVGYMKAYHSNNKLKDCYASGNVSGASSTGGLVGGTYNYSGLNNILCGYYCSSTTKQTDTGKGFSVTSSKMKQQATFEGWDFDNVWTIDSEVNAGFPTLQLPVTNTSNIPALEGIGSERTPFIITNERELRAFSRGEYGFNAVFKLANDITVTSAYWTPIGGNGRDNFSGTFDGNGHVISGIKLSQQAFVNSGLFGIVTGTVKNLGVDVSVSGAGTAGALTGMVDGGTIEYCYSRGAVSSVSGDTGGLIGFLQNGYVHDSYSTASVTNTGGGSAGGLVGYMKAYYSNNKLKDCYAAGNVSGASSSGGLVGGTYAYYGLNNILCGYYCSSTTKQTDTGKGFSVTSSKMKQQATFEGWDFDNVWTIDSGVNIGFPTLQLPVTTVKEEIELEGSGNEVDPFIISTEQELRALARGELENSFTAHYQLANDITVTSAYWTPIGGNGRDNFSGTFDGNGHVISGIKLSQKAFEFSGLFGIVTGTVKNLGVDVSVSGAGTAGALAGMVDGGTIEYCYSTGAVSSVSGDTGGLIGFLQNGYVHDSYSTASVTNTGGGSAGGLVGYMKAYYSNNKLKDCYAAGNVSGASSSGGLVGGTYAYYGLNNILCGYYCSSTTKQTDTGKGFSITSENMKQQSTFEGWDFDNVWTIDSEMNDGFPTLQLPITTVQEEIELEGSGNEVDPFIISTEQELRALARGELENSFAAHYQLANDITVTSAYWTPIGGNGRDNFSGTFDGNGHVISGIKLSQKAFEFSGLFGIVTGTVKNLGVDISVSRAGTAGALAGMVDRGTIEYCYSRGAVSSVSGDTGGLIGYLSNGYIHDSYSTAAATNTGGRAGGLVGYMYAQNSDNKLSNCYACGNVSGTSSTGGLVADCRGTNIILSSYFDNCSALSVDKGTYVSTESMKEQETFSDWDFTEIWGLSPDRNEGYPYLRVMSITSAVAVSGITLNKTTDSLVAGTSTTLTAIISPSNATNQSVIWTSTNPNVANVVDGTISAKAAGTTVITATTVDGGYSAICTVTVTGGGTPTVVKGDVNDDGEIDFADGIIILRHDAGMTALTGDRLLAGDVNGDGEVDFADGILVMRYDAGIISSL